MTDQVMTVSGPVPVQQMGITDAHNHLWIESLDVPADNAPVLDRMDLISQELTSYRETGGGAQLDCQPGGAGRNGNQLLKLSQMTGVPIVGCTGFHLQRYYPSGAEIWTYSSEQALAYFLAEINQGLLETRYSDPVVFPGFIKIAARETLASSPLHLLEAAVGASQESGLLVEMHTEKGADILRIVDQLAAWGLALDRLVICHIDKRPDLGLHQDLAKAGCLLEYDTFFRPKYDPDQNVWKLLRKMVEDGFSGSICLATDLADSALWEAYGGNPGLAGFPGTVGQQIAAEFSDESITARLMGGNISERLAGTIQEN